MKPFNRPRIAFNSARANTRPARKTPGALRIALLLAVLAVLTGSGCRSVNKLYDPSIPLDMVLIPEYRLYVKADKRLAPDEVALRMRIADEFQAEFAAEKQTNREKRQDAWGRVRAVFGKIIGLIVF